MSVTFDVERDRSAVVLPPACPKCGAQSGVVYGNPECDLVPEGDYVPCSGYGPSLPETGLNVSNVNAGVILFDLLGYGREEQDYACGDLDPADVLRRLSVAETRAASCVRSTREERGVYIDSNGVGPGALVIDCGLGLARLWTYVGALRKLAVEAVEAGRRITYG
jgi:hypothetical protein